MAHEIEILKVDVIGVPDRTIFTSGKYAEFEKSVGLPESFVVDLLKETDWSFLIKLHALLETGLTRALANHFGPSASLAEHFAQSSVDGPAGKIKLAFKAELIDTKMQDFLKRFAELEWLLSWTVAKCAE
jgi:hypothetical protein